MGFGVMTEIVAPARHNTDSNTPMPTPVGSGCDPSTPRSARVEETPLASVGPATRAEHYEGKADRAPIQPLPLPATPGLTRKQRDCLVFIDSYIRTHHISPSYEEIADGIGLRSKANIVRLIAALRYRGYVSNASHASRSIKVLAAPRPGLLATFNDMHAVFSEVVDSFPDEFAAKAILKTQLAAWRAAVTA